MTQEQMKSYMTNLWNTILRCEQSDLYIECTILNFESKIQAGWPDPR